MRRRLQNKREKSVNPPSCYIGATHASLWTVCRSARSARVAQRIRASHATLTFSTGAPEDVDGDHCFHLLRAIADRHEHALRCSHGDAPPAHSSGLAARSARGGGGLGRDRRLTQQDGRPKSGCRGSKWDAGEHHGPGVLVTPVAICGNFRAVWGLRESTTPDQRAFGLSVIRNQSLQYGLQLCMTTIALNILQ